MCISLIKVRKFFPIAVFKPYATALSALIYSSASCHAYS